MSRTSTAPLDVELVVPASSSELASTDDDG